jgi:hypothetical protein
MRHARVGTMRGAQGHPPLPRLARMRRRTMSPGKGTALQTRRRTMIDFTKGAAILAVAFTVAAAASPALAAKRAKTPGHDARAQAVGSDVTGSTVRGGDRESALRDCSAKAEGMKQYTWGVQQGYMFRNCMAERGQVE